jgi:hypothetical protein
LDLKNSKNVKMVKDAGNTSAWKQSSVRAEHN